MSQFVAAKVHSNSPSSRPKNITNSRQLTASAPVYTPKALHSQRLAYNNPLPIGRSFPNYPPPGFPVKNSPSRIASSYDRNVLTFFLKPLIYVYEVVSQKLVHRYF